MDKQNHQTFSAPALTCSLIPIIFTMVIGDVCTVFCIAPNYSDPVSSFAATRPENLGESQLIIYNSFLVTETKQIKQQKVAK